MNRIGLSIDGADIVEKNLLRLGQIIGPRLQGWGIQLLQEAQKIAVKRTSASYSPTAPAQENLLQVRTGNLRRYLLAQYIRIEDKSLAWGIDDSDEEGRIGLKLFHGGPITAKSGQALRIPLAAALTAKGVDKNDGVSFRGMDRATMRDKYGLTPWKSKAGNLLLMKITRLKKFSRFEPWYIIKKAVNIRPRNWFPDPEADLGGFVERTGEATLNTIMRDADV